MARHQTKYTEKDARRWIGVLSGCSSVTEACKKIGVPYRSVYEAMDRLGLGRPSEHVGVSARQDDPAADISRLSAFTRRPRTIEEVCNFLNCSPAKAREVLKSAREQGAPLNIQGDSIAWRLPSEFTETEPRVRIAQPIGGWFSFAAVGDVHFGSKYCRDDMLSDFFSIAYDRGVRTFFQVGDLLDGEYKKRGNREVRALGFDAQADEAIERLPRAEGAEWYFIDGNHDETFTQEAGIVTGRALVDRARRKGRADINFIGQRLGRLRLNTGLAYDPIVELWHPAKGRAYALSYHMQKRCADYEPGTKPDILLIGHWHTYCHIIERGIHAIACGTFQGHGSAFGNAIGGTQAIGSQIVSFCCTEHGTLRQVNVERVSYYEHEHERTIDAPRPGAGWDRP